MRARRIAAKSAALRRFSLPDRLCTAMLQRNADRLKPWFGLEIAQTLWWTMLVIIGVVVVVVVAGRGEAARW